jgi:hypothetical protein
VADCERRSAGQGCDSLTIHEAFLRGGDVSWHRSLRLSPSVRSTTFPTPKVQGVKVVSVQLGRTRQRIINYRSLSNQWPQPQFIKQYANPKSD